MKLFTSLLFAGLSEACSAKKELPAGFEVGSDDITPGLSCSAAPGDNRVVGGDIAEKGTWPWLVTLEVVDENGLAGLCGGTILSDTRILTAAHCFTGAYETQTTSDTTYVSVANWNSNDIEEEGEFVVVAENVRIHPNYGSNQNAYDFAILEIPDLSTVKPDSCIDCYDVACLPTEHAAHGRACWAGGWGAVRSGGRVSAKQKEVGVHIMNYEYCRNNTKYEDGDIIEDVEFCAGRPDMNGNGKTQKGADTCQGDSGGPLVCDDNGRPVLYGVVSWGIGCAWTGYPGIYAKVASELTWINQQL